MSRTIDEKVVEMRFDNSDFERNVTQSMSTLDKLKSALDFSGASKAFDGITSAANKVSFDGIKSGLKQLEEEFPVLGKIVDGVFLNMGRKIEDFVSNSIKSVTIEPIIEGFGKYARKTSSVQMIMNAIRDGTKSDSELMEEVNGQLERLMWYTDETSYDFTEMTASIGKFTSAGIGLEEAVTAMEGIANLAGISGATKQEANRAMYNISQALSGGFMRLQDWKSIENANMATKEFKEMLIKAAIDRGTLEEAVDEAGNTIWGVSTKSGFNEVNYKTVASTLTEGKWLTNEVLTDTLAMYGAFTDELSKVYDDINENADVTTSQIIKMTNQWKEGTLDMSEAMAMTGKSAEELEAIFASLGRDEYDLGRRAFAAAQEAKTFQEAIDATKDAVSTGRMKTFELLFGNYEEAKVLWTDLANELWDIFAGPISDTNDVLTAWRNNDDLGDGRDDLIEGLKNIYRAARSVIDPITEAWNAIFPPATYRDVWDFTHRFKEFTDSLIRSEEQVERIQQTFEGFFRGIEKIKDGVGGLIGAFKEGFESGGGIGGFIDGIAMAANQVGDTIYELTIGMSRVRGVLKDYHEGNLLDSGVVDDILEQFPLAAKLVDTYENLIGIYDKLADTFGAVGKAFGKMFDLSVFFKDGVLTFDSYIDGLKTKFASILELVTEVVHIWTGEDISRLTDSVRNFVFDIYDGIKALVGHEGWGKVKEELEGIGTAFTETFGGIKEFFGPAWQAAVTIFNDWLTGLRTILGGTSGDLDGFFGTITGGLQSVQDFIRNNEGFANFINGIKEGIQFISDFLVKFLSLTDAIEVYQANGGGILGILAVINDKIGIIIDTFADLVQNVTGFDIHGIGDGILSVIQGIGYAVLQLADTIAKAFGWKDNPFGKLLGQIDSEYAGFDGISVNLVGVFQRIGDAFSKLGDIFKAVSPGISSALSGVKVVLLDVIQFFKDISADMSFPDLLHLIMQIISVFSGIKLAKKAGEMFEAIGDALTAWQKTLKVQVLLELAGAILMIAGAAVLISKIDNDKIGLVIGTLATAFLGLIGVLAVSRAGNADNLKALPGIIISVAAAMVILSFAAGKLADVVAKFGEIENFWDAFGNFAGTLVTISILIGALSGLNARLTAKDGLTNTNVINGIVTAIGKLAVSMLLLLGVIKLYQMVDFKNILIGLGEMIVVLAGASAAMGWAEFLFNLISTLRGGFTSMESTATSMLKFAGAMAILAAVAGALTLIKWGDLGNSLLKMVSIIAAFSAGLVIFGAALALLDKLKIAGVLDKVADTIWKFAKAVAVLVGISVIIGLLSEVFGDSLKDLVDKGLEFIEYAIHSLSERSATIAHDLAVIIVDIIREALRVLAENIPEITQYLVEILGGLIQGVKDALASGDLDLGEVLGGTGLFAGILGLVILLKKNKVGVRDFGAAALAIGGAALLILEMGVLFAAMGYIGDAIGGVEGLKKMQEFASGIVHVFADDWGVLALFGVMMAFELLMSKYGDKLGGAKGTWKGFLTAASLITEMVALVDALGLLFAASGALLGSWGIPWIEKAGEFFSAIAKVFTEDNGGVFLLFTSMMALEVLFSKIKVNAGSTWSAFGTVISVLTEAVLLIDALGALFAATGGLIQGLDYLVSLGGNFDNSVVGWIEKAGDMYQAVGTAIGKLIGGLVGGIGGAAAEETLKGVGDGLAYIGETAGGFFELMSSLDQTAFEGFKNFGEMALSLGKTAILDAIGTFLGGKDKYKKFADGIADLGPGFKKFADAVEGINVSAVEDAGVCASIINALAKDVPNDGGVISWFTGDNDVGTFGKNLTEFGKGLMKYSYYVQNVDVNAIDATSSCIETLATVAKDLPNEGGLVSVFSGDNDFATFGENLESFGKSLFTYSAYAVQTYNNIDALNSIGEIVDSLSSAATTIDSISSVKDITKFGDNVVKFGNKLKEYAKIASEINVGDVNDVTSAVASILDTIVTGDSDTVNNKIEAVGNKILDGILALFGAEDSEKKTKEASDKIVTYICDKFKENASVSKFSVAITEMVNNAIGKDELKEGLKTAGGDIVTEIQNGITENFEGEEGLSAKFASFLESLLASIATDGQQGTKTRYYNAGSDLIKSLMNGMLNEEKISGFGSPAALQLKEGFKALLDSLIGLIVSEEMQGQFNRGGASLINAMLGGIKSVDVEAEMKSVGKNATLGYANGMVDQEALNQVAKSAKAATDIGINTAKTNLAEKSPSRVTMLIGQYFTQGFANGIYDKIPKAKEAVLTLMQKVKEGMGQNDLIALANNLGLNLDGALDDHIANLISQHGLDDFLNGDLDEMANSIMGALSNGEIYSGGGMESFDSWMSSFQAEYENSIPDLESMAQGIPEVFGTSMEEYANNGSVTNGANAITDNVSGVLSECYDTSGDYGYGTVYNYADNVLTASEEVQPILTTATENMTAPVEEGLTEMLTYAEWVAKQYPEGLTKELSVPTMDFDDLYENMKGGELEAILNMFDAMNDADRSKLIRAYGLGEEGGNADLANYLQWYWNNEPTRMQNLESIKQATEGYQVYLDEQKALQEAQAIQSQKNYEGVQQIAAGMNERADAADAKYMAAIEEIKMTVKSIEEELDSVHATISELNNMDVYIDSSALVGATAEKYNEELGNMAKIGRRRVTR